MALSRGDAGRVSARRRQGHCARTATRRMRRSRHTAKTKAHATRADHHSAAAAQTNRMAALPHSASPAAAQAAQPVARPHDPHQLARWSEVGRGNGSSELRGSAVMPEHGGKTGPGQGGPGRLKTVHGHGGMLVPGAPVHEPGDSGRTTRVWSPPPPAPAPGRPAPSHPRQPRLPSRNRRSAPAAPAPGHRLAQRQQTPCGRPAGARRVHRRIGRCRRRSRSASRCRAEQGPGETRLAS